MGCDCLKSLFGQSKVINRTNYTYEIEQLSSENLLKDETTSMQSNASKTSAAPDVNASLEDFVQLKTLGKGSFAKVTLVELKTNKKIFAMKILKKKALRKQKQIGHTKTERDMLEKMNCPFIVKLYYAFHDKEQIYFITEFMQGGELFFQLHKNSQLMSQERTVVFYSSEILLAIEYIHKQNYIYRDLKPENILFDKYGHVKLTDFGLSKDLNDNSDKAYTMCGTAEYLAPEILDDKGYDKTCDWFSFGVVLYEMLCGRHAFPRKNGTVDMKAYTRRLFYPPNVSDVAKDLISKLTDVNPKKRLGRNGADEIKQHAFYRGLNFNYVYNKRYKPPFIPQLVDDYDTVYFDKMFTSEKVDKLPNVSTPNKMDFDGFEGFSYQPNNPLE